MAWKNATLTYELGAGGRQIVHTGEVETSDVIDASVRVRNGGLVRFRRDGAITHVNADRIITIQERPGPDPAEAVRAADGE